MHGDTTATGRELSRRSFLRNATAAGIAAPFIVPASALGSDGHTAPSNRITLGCIGVGSKGTQGMRNFLPLQDAHVVAVCDPHRDSRLQAQSIANAHYAQALGRSDYNACDDYNDFRDLLARDDIDAVLVATPDHWHVPHALAAIRSGKDVYGEKPMGATVAEGSALVDAVRRHGRIFQHGTQLRSLRNVRYACELVRNGRLGKIHTVRIGSPQGITMDLQAPMKVPDGFDYDLWVGPAPWAPYTPERVKVPGKLPGWYFITDYSPAGWVAGFGVHDMDIAQWGLGMEHTGPLAVEGQGVYPKDGLFDTVTTYHLEYTYPNDVKIILATLDENPRHGVTFEGTEGWVYVRGGIDAEPKSLLTSSIGPDEVHLYESKHHEADFINCVKTRRDPIAPVEAAHMATTACEIGDIAMRLERRLEWDTRNERFVDDEEADRMLSRAHRAPWTL